MASKSDKAKKSLGKTKTESKEPEKRASSKPKKQLEEDDDDLDDDDEMDSPASKKGKVVASPKKTSAEEDDDDGERDSVAAHVSSPPLGPCPGPARWRPSYLAPPSC